LVEITQYVFCQRCEKERLEAKEGLRGTLGVCNIEVSPKSRGRGEARRAIQGEISLREKAGQSRTRHKAAMAKKLKEKKKGILLQTRSTLNGRGRLLRWGKRETVRGKLQTGKPAI